MSKRSERWLTASFLTLAICGVVSTAKAGILTSSSGFSAVTSGLTVENYGAYSAGTPIANGGALGGLTYSFNTASGLGGVITNDYNSFSGESLAALQTPLPLNANDYFYSNEGFTVTFPSPVTAVGIFSNTNLPVAATISAGPESGTVTFSAYDTSTFGFLGITSSTPFSSVTFTSSTFNIAEIEFGTAVPETPTWALLLMGVAGLGAAIRIRRSVRMA
jgi:hypothetical protein